MHLQFPEWTCDVLQMQISALCNRKRSGEGAVLELQGSPCIRCLQTQCMLKSLSQLESLTPSFSSYPSGLKKRVFSHRLILCGLSYKNAPAGFSIWKTCFSFVKTYIIFFLWLGFLLCCFKLKANVLPSPSFLIPHPHLCMFQLQSCENKSSFGFCYFKTAIGDVRVNTKSIKNAGRM